MGPLQETVSDYPLIPPSLPTPAIRDHHIQALRRLGVGGVGGGLWNYRAPADTLGFDPSQSLRRKWGSEMSHLLM